jgi:hypothetical protein
VKRVLIFCSLMACLANAFAEEKKYSYLLTNDFTYQKSRLARDPDQFYNSSSAFFKFGNWSGGLNLTGRNYYKQSTSYTMDDPEVFLYRKYVQYTAKGFEALGGDFNSVLGRGLVLSVLQNEKAYRDRTVLGGDFQFHSWGWQLRALGGTVEDETRQQKWGVAGGEISRAYWKGNRVGFHTSYIHDVNTWDRSGDRTTWSVSWNADRLPGGFSYYAEISRMNLHNSDRDGSAYYTNVGWTHKGLTFMFEYRKYKDFDNRLNNPPSADRGDEGVLELADSETLRLYSQYSFLNPDSIAFVSIGRVRDADAIGPQVYTGVSASEIAGGRLDFSFGYNFRETYYPEKIVDGQATFRLTNRIALGFSGRDKRFTQWEYHFNEQDWIPQISWAPYGSVFYQRQYSRDLIDHRHDFDSYGIHINVKRDSYLEVSTGRMRGGQVCSSGQCVFLPPFRGWRVGVFTTVR